MKRIFLFILTNPAVLAVLSVAIFVIERVFGVRLPTRWRGLRLASMIVAWYSREREFRADRGGADLVALAV